MNESELEAQIDEWRSYVRRRQAIAAVDVDELEDHLREQIGDLQETGLNDDEAFLVSIKRLGNLDSVSNEFAREHSERLWKQLVLVPDGRDDTGQSSWLELGLVLGLGIAAGVAVRVGTALFTDMTLLRNVGFLAIPFLVAYFTWKRRIPAQVVGVLALSVAALATVINLYPFIMGGSTEALAALHVAVVLWMLVGVAYVGGQWRLAKRRMDFVRFTGELAIYFVLLALGGGVLLGLTATVLETVGVDFEPIMEWVLPFAVPGALIVAVWLVEAKQHVVENIAPVLTRVFTPLTLVMLLAILGVLLASGDLANVNRDILIVMDGILLLVLCLLLYSISARDSLAPPGVFDALQLALVVAALLVNAVMMTAMATRIFEFGFSPNKIAAIGLNVLLLVHLGRAAWLSVGFLRREVPFGALERWQTQYLPIYGIWALIVVVAFPPIFGFA